MWTHWGWPRAEEGGVLSAPLHQVVGVKREDCRESSGSLAGTPSPLQQCFSGIVLLSTTQQQISLRQVRKPHSASAAHSGQHTGGYCLINGPLSPIQHSLPGLQISGLYKILSEWYKIALRKAKYTLKPVFDLCS